MIDQATAQKQSRLLAALAVVVFLVMTTVLSACFARMASTRHLTGTCDGACAHYLSCKSSRTEAAETACVSDCQQVFADADSLRAFESLSCEDAIEYVDGEGGTRHASDGAAGGGNASSQAQP